MPEESQAAGKVGSVSTDRYAEIVVELRNLVEVASRAQFTIGDYALEVEPMRGHGGAPPADELFTVRDSLFRLAEDIGVSYSSVRQARWTASKWPKGRRVSGVSFTVHNILASIADDEERRGHDPDPAAGQGPVDSGRGQPAGRPPGHKACHSAGEGQRDSHPRPGRGGRRHRHR